MKAKDIMKFGPGTGNQPTVDQARAAMLAAGEAPGSVKAKAANDARRSAFNEAIAQGATVVEARAIAAQAAAVASGAAVEPATSTGTVVGPTPAAPVRTPQRNAPAPAPAAQPQERAERLETPKFVAEIKQVGGQWVCELIYKNGAGTERFVAPTKSQLMLKVAEGKGNATLKIRSNAQVARLNAYQYDHAYTFEGFTQEEYDALTEKVKDQLIDATAAKAVIRFKEDNPEFLPSALNSQKLREFLDARKAVITLKNLEMAYATLSAMEELEVRDFEPTVVDGSTVVEDSTPVASTAPAVSTAAPVVAEPQLRKRGTTGLMPGFSSAGDDTTLDSSEEVITPREPSRAELLALPLEEHRKLFKASLKTPNRSY